jgi:hypothetical protein
LPFRFAVRNSAIVRSINVCRYLENLKSWGVGWRSYQEPWLDTGNERVTGIVLSVIAAIHARSY